MYNQPYFYRLTGLISRLRLGACYSLFCGFHQGFLKSGSTWAVCGHIALYPPKVPQAWVRGKVVESGEHLVPASVLSAG